MNSYIINGGRRLKGEVTINASKNSATAILIASLLNEGKTTIKNLPRIEEVFRIIEVLESIGVKTKWQGKALEIIPPQKIEINKINKEAAQKTRSIVLFIGALAGKLKSFDLPLTGGCQLGRRTIMPHIYALEEMGVKIKGRCDSLSVSSKLKPAKEIIMYESGDTATENAIIIAAKIPAKTIIKFASANYQVQDLCYFLQKLGIKIKGIGATTLTIYGKEKISQDIDYWLTEDPVESMFFIATAAVTKSSIVIKRCPMEFLELELFKLKKMGFCFKILKEYKARNGFSRLADIKTFPSKLTAPVEKIYGRPFPGLNIDNLPFFVPIATQAKGETLIHDWVYENRAIYYTELNHLAADITLADSHRVFIKGPTSLSGSEIMSPPALRPSAIILVAMLGAKGKSVLKNTYAIERGYEDLVGRLKKLGAKIENVIFYKKTWD
ncbi:MAG: UDP-N-acetylglucosamine 1-carboxyvinyltransferase [Candidatus Terrybacteria bacterium]|nr:UDP-N-acetylglucosamine 1-carboxyvinyltransferase [Candidatus Terrybacteria bacterium]MBI4812058.1 UDP-N-acetylglucosamine 1-carboxyvinyltransferase [Candidatus Falkowbacteria bacterium]